MYHTPLKDDLKHILSHTLKLWEKLKNNRIFITGGTGYFGCWLLESLLWANNKLNLNTKLVVLTRDVDAFIKKEPHLSTNKAISFHEGDVRNFSFPSGQFSDVIHAATAASKELNDNQPTVMYDTILNGTMRTLEFAKDKGVKRFLFTSSGAVYGIQPSDISHMPESYVLSAGPDDPTSAYGMAKLAAEHLCILYSRKYKIETKIARCYAQVGPHLPLDIHFAMGNFIRDGMKGGPIIVNGNGTPKRSYLYASDLMIWLWTILLKGKSCRPYNVGSENAISISDLAQCVAEILSSDIEVLIRQPTNPSDEIEQYVPSTQRAQSELDLLETVDLVQGIKRTIMWNKMIINSSVLSES